MWLSFIHIQNAFRLSAEREVPRAVQKSTDRSAVKIMYNDRNTALMLQAETRSILILQVYMPTSEYEDDKVEELYGVTKEIISEDGKGVTRTIIMGTWNSVVGDKSYGSIVGPHALGRRNHRGHVLINCERTGLDITNTWFEECKR
jgi:exonuclease III